MNCPRNQTNTKKAGEQTPASLVSELFKYTLVSELFKYTSETNWQAYEEAKRLLLIVEQQRNDLLAAARRALRTIATLKTYCDVPLTVICTADTEGELVAAIAKVEKGG